MSRPEYTWAVDSVNGRCPTDPKNPTNDLDIPTRMPRLRTPVTQIYLGSIELPLAQFLVERLWNTLYFDEGVRLIVNTDSDLCTREFTVIVNGTPVTAILPILYNPVVDVDVTDPTAPIFTTMFDHALDLRGEWNWGSPIQLVSTPLTDPNIINLTLTNPHLTVLSPNTFQLSGIPPTVFPNPGGIYGYVHAPPIASPALLAQITQAALNLVAPGEFRLSYDINTGRFTFQSIRTVNGTCVTNPPLAHENLVIAIPTRNCLAALMGFGCGNVPVPTPPSLTQNLECKVDTTCQTFVLEGGFGYQCFSQIRIMPGNYGPESFAGQLNLQWNRFFFDGGCSNNPLLRPVFVFSSSNGACVSFPIEFGTYTPDTFAEYVETQMNLLDPLGNTYTVSWDMATGLFCFKIDTPGATFGLEFADPANTFNPAILGFDAVAHRGQNTYCSTTPFQVPTNSCCGTDTLRFSSLVFAPRVFPGQGKFVIQVNPPRCVPTAFLTDLGGGVVEIFTTAPNLLAHGLQPEDLVEVRDTATGTTYELRVIEVVDAFRIHAEIGSVAPFIGAVNLPVSFCYGDAPVASLLWADRQRPNPLPPRFLGYTYQDALFDPSVPIPPFVSPNSFDLEGPKYLLMVITDPNGATHTNHAWEQNNIPNVFAKVILYPQFRLERNYPMIMYVPSVVQVEKMHFIFLNPDHTPYQFHGKQWSCTLNMAVPEAQLEMTCY